MPKLSGESEGTSKTEHKSIFQVFTILQSPQHSEPCLYCWQYRLAPNNMPLTESLTRSSQTWERRCADMQLTNRVPKIGNLKMIEIFLIGYQF